jgi:hypothetical protein
MAYGVNRVLIHDRAAVGMNRMSAPPSSMCVAQARRKRSQLSRFGFSMTSGNSRKRHKNRPDPVRLAPQIAIIAVRPADKFLKIMKVVF